MERRYRSVPNTRIWPFTSSAPADSRRDIYTVVAQPGRDRISEPHMHGVSEHLIIMSGRALVGPLDNPVSYKLGTIFTTPEMSHI